jgi:hypothetical protein
MPRPEDFSLDDMPERDTRPACCWCGRQNDAPATDENPHRQDGHWSWNDCQRCGGSKAAKGLREAGALLIKVDADARKVETYLGRSEPASPLLAEIRAWLKENTDG